MSVAAATTTILFKRKIGAVSSTIISPKGDLVQYYDETPTNPGKIYQDFTEITPFIYLVASSSRATDNLDFAGSVDVYVNNELLIFKDNFSTNSFNGETGHFKLTSSPGKAYNDGITIVKNLVTAFEGNQVVIKIVGRLTDGGGTSDDISATYTIPVQKSTGSGYHVTIAAGDDNNFIITNADPKADNGHCELVAKVYSIDGEGTAVTEGLTYSWQMESEAGWGSSIGTSDNVTINASDVSSMANIRVTVTKDGETIGTDIQTVRDNTDNMTIDLGASPKDETIIEGSGGKVTYTPKLLLEGKEQSGYLFRFAASDSSGVPLNTAGGDDDPSLAAATEAMESFDVTEAMCEQAGGNVALSIFAVKQS